MAYEQRSYAGNAADTTLSADVTSGALTFSVKTGDGSSYPDGSGGPFYVIVDYDTTSAEKIRVTSRSGDSFVVPASNGRGVDGTVATTHSAGAKVRHCWTATDAQEANRAALNTVGKVTAKGDLLLGTAANALGRKAVGADGTFLQASSADSTGVTWASVPTDGAAGTGSLRTLGTAATQAAAGNDSRLSDQRAPTAHTHADGTHGGQLTPTVALSATGTPSSATFLRGDNTWAAPGSGTKTIRVPHTWAITGGVAVPSGDTNYLPPMFVDLPSGQTATLAAVRYVVHTGTSFTFKLQVAGSDATGFTGLTATTTAGRTAPTAVTLADGNLVAPVVTAVSGSPVNGTVTVFVDYTV